MPRRRSRFKGSRVNLLPFFDSFPLYTISPWVFAVRNSRAQRNRTLPPILDEPSASTARLGLS